MDFKTVAMDLKVWLLIAIVAGLALPPVTDRASELVIILLMVQMTFSMDGLVYKRASLTKKSNFVNSMMLCYVINTVITLIVGSVFLGIDKDIWYGFAMMAAMPCAVAVISGTVLKNNDINDAVASVTFTYIVALVLSPIISYLAIGDAVNPLEILKYIFLFILIPFVITRLTSRLNLKRETKVPIINLSMALIMFLCVNRASGSFFFDPAITAMVFVAVILRILLLDVSSVLYIKRCCTEADRETTFHIMGVWKNTGLSISMCMILLSAMPAAIIPGAISIIFENLWFAIVTGKNYGNWVKRESVQGSDQFLQTEK